MNIKETFLKLTQRTYPHGTEAELYNLLPPYLLKDSFGNLYFQIGESPTIMFASHLDTATSANTTISHIIEGDLIKTDGKSILGADDKAGVTIMLNMLENNVPGLYYFFLGEEVGCLGSKNYAERIKNDKIEHINKVISFDRRGTTSVISHQFGTRCCSDEFANDLSEKLNQAGLLSYINDTKFEYKPDPTGLYTDSAQFTRIYPECTNISVGYKSEHTFNEEQNIKHLEKLAEACLLIDWDSLIIKRDPSTYEYRSHSSYGGGYSYWNDEFYEDYEWSGKGKYTSPIISQKTVESHHFMDDKYGFVSTVKLKKGGSDLVEIEISDERIQDEKLSIVDLMYSLEVDYTNVSWDGFNLKVNYADGHKTECGRKELAEFLPELDFWRVELGDYDPFY